MKDKKLNLNSNILSQTTKSYRNNNKSPVNNDNNLFGKLIPPTRAFGFKNITYDPAVKRIDNNKKQYNNLNRSMDNYVNNDSFTGYKPPVLKKVFAGVYGRGENEVNVKNKSQLNKYNSLI